MCTEDSDWDITDEDGEIWLTLLGAAVDAEDDDIFYDFIDPYGDTA